MEDSFSTDGGSGGDGDGERLGSPVPNRLWTSSGLRPGGGGPLGYKMTAVVQERHVGGLDQGRGHGDG